TASTSRYRRNRSLRAPSLAPASTATLDEAPANRLTAAQRHNRRIADRQFSRQRPFFAAQRDLLFAARQTIEIRAEEAGEAFELVQRACFVERFRVELERMQRRVAPRAAARVLLQTLRMRCAIRAEEEARIARGRRLDQRHAMC